MTKITESGSVSRSPQNIANEADAPLLLDLPAAAAALGGLSQWSVRALIASGDLPVVAIPSPTNTRRPMRRVLIPRDALVAYIARHTEGGR